jgi:hypothetical protein
MDDPDQVYAHSPHIVTRKTGNEYVLVPVTNNIADMNSVYTLNETGAFLWDQINGNRTLEVIIDNLTDEYATDRKTAEDDVKEFIMRMKEFLIICKPG